jgi:hypothetical protein
MLCEVVPLCVENLRPEAIRDRLREEVQLYLHGGWTLRAQAVYGDFIYLTFVRKEAR